MATGMVFEYDIERLKEDIALRGWLPVDLARRAEISDMTVYRFLDGRCRTPKTAKKIADALGYSIRRYLVTKRQKGALV